MYTYDEKFYDLDKLHRQESYAAIKDGALLYRLVSLSHCEQRHVLSGDGPMKVKSKGRFHTIEQRTSYCANNVLVCLAEVLYHTYRRFLAQLESTQPRDHSNIWTTQHLRLAIFLVKPIDNLVYVDSIGAKDYDSRIISSTVVFPDPIYGPLHTISDNLRQKQKSGVVYPSARHSRDFAFAFFKNETRKIKIFYSPPLITLRLIAEDQNVSSLPPKDFLVQTDKLHATMGYYEFDNPQHLEDLKRDGLIHPREIPSSGYIDFVRRHYNDGDYPRCAVRP